MRAKLDNLELVLIHHLKDDPSNPLEDLRTIFSVWTGDRRAIIEHKVPGKEGSVFQDLGRHSLRFALAGEFAGAKSKTVAEALWQKFEQGKTLPFTSDVATLARVKKVVIEQLEFEDLAGRMAQFKYRIIMREHKEPSQKKAQAPNQADKAKKKVKEETGKAKGAVNYVTGKVLDSDKNPVEDAEVIITGEDGEVRVNTDENGVFRRDNLEPGKYKVKVNDPAYEEEKEVEVESAEGEGGETSEGQGEESSGGEGGQPTEGKGSDTSESEGKESAEDEGEAPSE